MTQLQVVLELLAELATTVAQVVVRSMVTVIELMLAVFHPAARGRFLQRWRTASALRRTTIVAEAAGCTAVVGLCAVLGVGFAVAALRPPAEVADKPRIDWDVKDPLPTPWTDRADDEPLLEVELTTRPAAAEEDAAAPQPARKRRFDITRRDYHRITGTETLLELTKASADLIKEKARQLRKAAGQAAPDEAVPEDGKQLMEEKDDGC